MSVVFNYQGFAFELLDGEFRRYRNNSGEADHEEYLCVAKYKSNRILTQHIRTDGEIVDYVETLFSNLPEFAFEYLMEVLDKYTNVIVRATYVAMEDAITTFEIYYNCDCENDQIDSIINWMVQHNDFAAETYRYTEVLNGHQECVGTYSDEKIADLSKNH